MSQAIPDLAPLTLEASPYKAPFNDNDADLILHTSDGGRFAVHKIFLTTASPLLKRTLAVGSSSPLQQFAGIVVKPGEGQDVFELVEDSLTTERVLHYCYPFANPVLESLDDIQNVLDMMKKFDMRGLMDRVRSLIVQQPFLDAEPLRIFAIAYRYGFEAETRLAARYTLRHPLFGPYVKELEHIPASTYHKLLQYHRKCSLAASGLTSDFSWFPGFASRWVWFQCDDCMHHLLSWPLSDGKIYEVNAWFIEYMERTRVVLRDRPCAKAVSEPMLIVEALETATNCHTCRPAAYLDLSTFITEHFMAEIEKVIDGMELDLSFHHPA